MISLPPKKPGHFKLGWKAPAVKVLGAGNVTTPRSPPPDLTQARKAAAKDGCACCWRPWRVSSCAGGLSPQPLLRCRGRARPPAAPIHTPRAPVCFSTTAVAARGNILRRATVTGRRRGTGRLPPCADPCRGLVPHMAHIYLSKRTMNEAAVLSSVDLSSGNA